VNLKPLPGPSIRSQINGAFADGRYVYLTWTDYRMTAAGTIYARNQADIRMVKITWPAQ